MYFVNQGRVSVQVNGGEIDCLHAGDMFGEIALVMSVKRIADVVSLGLASGGEKADSLRSHSDEVKRSAPWSYTTNDYALLNEEQLLSPADLQPQDMVRQSFSHDGVQGDQSRYFDGDAVAHMHAREHGAGKTDAVELFRLMRTDFELVLEKFPVLKSRLVSLGRVRLQRKDKLTQVMSPTELG
jgi:hypothetical protein